MEDENGNVIINFPYNPDGEYVSGYNARMSGFSDCECPYSEDSVLCREWIMGWNYADGYLENQNKNSKYE
jgi:hypothetical protein